MAWGKGIIATLEEGVADKYGRVRLGQHARYSGPKKLVTECPLYGNGRYCPHINPSCPGRIEDGCRFSGFNRVHKNYVEMFKAVDPLKQLVRECSK